ncbi:peptidase inhibitor I9 [Colletotrichum cuscutae]|uniref:Peptidase inhibitor I9 n=1 Tax=Colletotrichum cuscutae TaxID=1209917 RepID=A0AAI9Y380_9PEZI|nr:peptidase inhibitor I9 [Colletotrichum cuscutae]
MHEAPDLMPLRDNLLVVWQADGGDHLGSRGAQRQPTSSSHTHPVTVTGVYRLEGSTSLSKPGRHESCRLGYKETLPAYVQPGSLSTSTSLLHNHKLQLPPYKANHIHQNAYLHCEYSSFTLNTTITVQQANLSQVTCKEDASADQVAAAKKHATDQGGKIGHEYSLIKGFSVEFPEDQISTLESHEHVKHVEKDQEVKTQ